MKKFELVIPAYNEEKNIPELIERVVTAAAKFNMTGQDFTLLLVENGSKDNSYKVMRDTVEYLRLHDMVKIVQVKVNQGYGFGIMSGLRESSAPVVGWTHADLQCDPANAFVAYKLYEVQTSKNILVKGVRLKRSAKDRFVSRVFETFARIILGLKVYELNAQPKVFPSTLLENMKQPPHTFALDLYLLYSAQKAGLEVLTFNVFFRQEFMAFPIGRQISLVAIKRFWE
ncbi:MAG: glycosyltransferase family 2 protein [Bdellovibrionales bacterium]|nr:glycosyltransferase family 2 protein [Bdellovibrionales bacterium]